MGLLRALLGSSVFLPLWDFESELLAFLPFLSLPPLPSFRVFMPRVCLRAVPGAEGPGRTGLLCRFSSWLVHGAGAEAAPCFSKIQSLLLTGKPII